MHKYFQVYKATVQHVLIYRSALFIYRLSNFLLLLVMASVWLSASAPGLIGGFSSGSLLTYYVVGMVMVSFIMWYPVNGITKEINSGQISVIALTKPINYFWYKFFTEAGWNTISPFFGLLSLTASYLLFGSGMVISITPLMLVIFLLSVCLSAALVFSFTFNIGLLSFWFTDTDGFTEIFWMCMFLFGGQGIPISFYPDILKQTINFVPFRFIFSFPLEIFTGKLNSSQISSGFILQIFWILFFAFLSRWVWRKGLKTYSSYGN